MRFIRSCHVTTLQVSVAPTSRIGLIKFRYIIFHVIFWYFDLPLKHFDDTFQPDTYFLIQTLATLLNATYTAQQMKFPIKDFLSKCDQIHSFLLNWSHLLKKSLMENFIFCAVIYHPLYNKWIPKSIHFWYNEMIACQESAGGIDGFQSDQ